MASVGRKPAPSNRDRGGRGIKTDPTLQTVLCNIEPDSMEEAPGTTETISRVRQELMPEAIEAKHKTRVRACEDYLQSHNIYEPNCVSGYWEPPVEPVNEMHLREMYHHRMPEFGFMVVRSVSAFPDWLCCNRQGEFSYVEVELLSSSFSSHGHDPALCDLVVCWKHNDDKIAVDVLELSTGEHFTTKFPVQQKDKCSLPVNLPPKQKDSRRKEYGYAGLVSAVKES